MASSQILPADPSLGKVTRRKRGHSQGDGPRPATAHDSLSETQKRLKTIDASQIERCQLCGESSSVAGMIQCECCENHRHLKCCSIASTHQETARELLHLVGWACRECRTSRTDKQIFIESALADLSRQINELKAIGASRSITEQNKSINRTRSAQSAEVSESSEVQRVVVVGTAADVGAGRTAPNSLTRAQVVSIVSRTINDKSRRLKNVIISGLPETSSVPDIRAFESLCEEHLPTKPALSNLGVKRLGKPPTGANRHRRLLVHFESEEAASELLRSSRVLSSSHDPYVASNIFINPDLSVSEQKEAYDKRVHRRHQGRGASSGPHGAASDWTSRTASHPAPSASTDAPPTQRFSEQIITDHSLTLLPTVEITTSHGQPTSYSNPHTRPLAWVHGGHQTFVPITPQPNHVCETLPITSIPLSENQHAYWPGTINHSQTTSNTPRYLASAKRSLPHTPSKRALCSSTNFTSKRLTHTCAKCA